METSPKVSIITITFNLIDAGRKRYFRQCVESIHDQLYGNIEHIIIDGASTDGTLALIKEYADRGWLTYYSEKDNGIYNAMNKGIDKCSGDYVNFLNSDDYFSHPEGVAASVQALLESNADYSFSQCSYQSLRNKYLGVLNPQIECFLFRMPFCHQTVFIKREKLLGLEKFDETFNSAADFDFVMRLCLSGATFVETPLNFVTYRVGGLSDTNQEQSINECALACKKNLSQFAEFEIEIYKNMYTDLLFPKSMYEAITQKLDHEYKIRFIRLVKHYSTSHGQFLKITKYPRLEEIPYFIRMKRLLRRVPFLKSLIKIYRKYSPIIKVNNA